MDDERLKNPNGHPDYFDGLLEHIRDIKASKKKILSKTTGFIQIEFRLRHTSKGNSDVLC